MTNDTRAYIGPNCKNNTFLGKTEALFSLWCDYGFLTESMGCTALNAENYSSRII